MHKEFIYRHINNLPPQEIFTSRHMLIYGKRTMVDSALRDMVNEKFIYRLARGIFVRDPKFEPTLAEIVEAKLASYRLKASDNAESKLHELKLYPFGNSNTFVKNGSSSSFMTVRGRAYLTNICERKMKLCQSQVGQLVFLLWYLNNTKLYWKNEAVDIACANIGRQERELLWLASALMPAWLRENCEHIFPPIKLQMHNPFLEE